MKFLLTNSVYLHEPTTHVAGQSCGSRRSSAHRWALGLGCLGADGGAQSTSVAFPGPPLEQALIALLLIGSMHVAISFESHLHARAHRDLEQPYGPNQRIKSATDAIKEASMGTAQLV